MKTKITLCILLMFAGLAAPLSAQVKMGHANLELILAYMPETQTMNQALQEANKVLEERVKVKQNYLQTKVGEYQAAEPSLTDEQKQAAQQDLQKLDQEVKMTAQGAQQQMMLKQQELLGPITVRLEAAIKELAAEEGYTYILNSMTSGNSIVLHGPPEHELTEKLMTKLGIEIPKEGSEDTAEK